MTFQKYQKSMPESIDFEKYQKSTPESTFESMTFKNTKRSTPENTNVSMPENARPKYMNYTISHSHKCINKNVEEAPHDVQTPLRSASWKPCPTMLCKRSVFFAAARAAVRAAAHPCGDVRCR